MKYQVADYIFEVVLPQGMRAEEMLPSFRDFVCTEEGPLLFRFDATAEGNGSEVVELLDESVNDMGHVKVWRTTEGYQIEAHHELCEQTHVVTADREFRHIRAAIRWEARYAEQMLSSLLRIVFSQAVLREEGIGIHASAVTHKGKAYLFLGKSGTGKSTHARLWLQHIPGTELINDDNPAIRIKEGTAYAYGTPWSGKTPCYRNVCYPIGGIARLRQAPHNRFRQLDDVEAFMALLPGCAVIKQDTALYDALCNKLTWLAENITIGMMECLPDGEAALCMGEGLWVMGEG